MIHIVTTDEDTSNSRVYFTTNGYAHQINNNRPWIAIPCLKNAISTAFLMNLLMNSTSISKNANTLDSCR